MSRTLDDRIHLDPMTRDYLKRSGVPLSQAVEVVQDLRREMDEDGPYIPRQALVRASEWLHDETRDARADLEPFAVGQMRILLGRLDFAINLAPLKPASPAQPARTPR